MAAFDYIGFFKELPGRIKELFQWFTREMRKF
jgi:hypothetical protein